MNTGWYKNINPHLQRLTSLLSSSKPSHGYTISEKGPEIVTAPGVYFPAEEGKVIPLKPRADGGSVEPPLHSDPERAKLEMVHKIIGHIKTAGLEHHAHTGMVMPPESMKIEQSKYDILKSALGILRPPPKVGEKTISPTKPTQPSRPSLTPRQDGGDVTPPDNTPDLTTSPDKSPLDKFGEYLRQLTTMFSRANGGDVVPPEDELARLRQNMLLGAENPAGDVAARMRVSEQPFQPSTPAGQELAAREMWNTPGVPESMLATAKENISPNVTSVIPGFQKSYYDAHPEEKVADEIAASNRSADGAANKTLEDVRNRVQGYGLSMNPKIAATQQAEATKLLPTLTGTSERLAGVEGGTRERLFRDTLIPGAKVAPHLVQTADGSYMWATPGGVMPAGIMGKSTEKSPTEWSLTKTAQEKGADGKPTSAATEAQGILDANEKRKLDIAMGGIPPMSPEATLSQTTPETRKSAALAGLTPEQQSVVQKLANYELPIPGSFAMKDPKWQALMGRAATYDPSFDATQYAVRQKIRTDFTSGKAANNIRSLNTAVGHLDTLSQKTDALINGGVPLWNAIKNKGLTATGDKRVTEFNAAATAVENELANVFKGMGASDQEIKAWRINLSSSQSPEQLRGVIDTAIQLLGGRLGALQAQYETGMGKPKAFQFLSTKSRGILQKLGANMSELDTGETSSTGGTKTVTERRKTQDGRTLVKYSDGTIAEEK